MKIGVIGTGNMGTILIEAWLETKTLEPANLLITNRTLSKALALQEKYACIEVTETAVDIAKRADVIFICVKPLQIHNLLQVIKPYINKDQLLVSITSPLSVAQLEHEVPCSCARFIPSITNRACSGVSLLSYSKACLPKWRSYLHELARKISTPVVINNNITRVSSDIVSCGPAFFSFFAQSFIDAACQSTEIDRKTATILTEKMLMGLGDLLSKGIYTLPTLQEKVSVKGGITGEGIKVLEAAKLHEVFSELLKATHEKFDEDIEEIEKQFRYDYNIRN
ncbi:late competence protein ComER [Peribacillus asahii]|uniref:Late competence protein ComER n=1 Tax=Peribacillus asahii TaxID=228899 RepID=A0A398BLT8_9BACI|nr:late competence protein ComER [Peribacillus asahii]RID89488.1 late competence protein ComER [Peribacillus asahii]